MQYAAMGKVLWVDLSTGDIREETIPDEMIRQTLTGVGLAAKLLIERIPAGADPLGPDNVLGFTAGLLCGTGAFFQGRWMVVGKSPLTGGWGDANCGGNFAPVIKRCGYDAVFFTGISEHPVYLKVIDGKPELVDAAHLWGVDALESEGKVLAEVNDPRARALVIGPAAEKKSLISGIVNDHGRIAARSGMGAVMGAKRLKAVVMAGSRPVRVHDRARIKQASQKLAKWLDSAAWLRTFFTAGLLGFTGTLMRKMPGVIGMTADQYKLGMGKYGTTSTNVLSSESGDSPVKNWKGVGYRDFPKKTHSDKLNPQRLADRETVRYHCHGCPFGCGSICDVDGKYKIRNTHKPEYETCCAFGALILSNDLDAVFRLNDILNRAGMDTISAGATVAFAIECVEQGALNKEDMDGIDLSWGNAEAVVTFVGKMIDRDGIGDLFADGSKVAAKKIGKGSEAYAMHAGGQELPMHDSRFDPGFALSYVLEPTPGRHTNHGYQWIDLFALHKVFKGLPKTKPYYTTKTHYHPDGKPELQAVAGQYMQLINAAGGCLFGAQMGGHVPLVEYLNAATGWDYEPEHYLQIGERIQNIRQAFNFKHGIEPLRDFKLPARALGEPPLDDGSLKGVTIPFKQLSENYLRRVGWDEQTGRPTPEKLRELGLDDLIDDLYPNTPGE